MKRAWIGAVAVALALGLGGGAALSRADDTQSRRADGRIAELSGSIGFLERRLREDPENFVAASHLVGRYLLRFQLGADLADVERAERVARALLATTPDRAGALAQLSNVHLTQHAFAAALQTAQAAVHADSTSEAALASLFDAAMASGQYDQAQSALRQLGGESVPGRLRVAQWQIAQGEGEGAYANLERTCDALQRAAAAPQTVAWCLTELAGLRFEHDGERAARALYRKALHLQPGYRGAVEGLADLAHARGDWARAQRLYASVATDAHPDLYLRLGEVTRALGEEARAVRYDSVFLSVAAAPGAEPLYAHPLALFYARSPATLDQALGVARRDVQRRPAVESYDLLAWVLYRRGKMREALEMSDRARGWGSPSTTMDYHRAMILDALGRGATADSLRTQALARPELLDPHLRIRAGADLRNVR